MLDTLNIQYKQQYTFSNLFSNRECDKLYYDFAIFNNKIIKNVNFLILAKVYY